MSPDQSCSEDFCEGQNKLFPLAMDHFVEILAPYSNIKAVKES